MSSCGAAVSNHTFVRLGKPVRSDIIAIISPDYFGDNANIVDELCAKIRRDDDNQKVHGDFLKGIGSKLKC